MEDHTVLREFKVNYTFLSKAQVHSNLTHETREDNTLKAQDTIYQTLPCTMNMWFLAWLELDQEKAKQSVQAVTSHARCVLNTSQLAC